MAAVSATEYEIMRTRAGNVVCMIFTAVRKKGVRDGRPCAVQQSRLLKYAGTGIMLTRFEENAESPAYVPPVLPSVSSGSGGGNQRELPVATL